MIWCLEIKGKNGKKEAEVQLDAGICVHPTKEHDQKGSWDSRDSTDSMLAVLTLVGSKGHR